MEKSKKEELIINQIKKVYDPEIPVNVYDLGLIYDCRILSNNQVEVLMTLTSPSCSMAGMILDQVKTNIKKLEFVKEVTVELTWDPPWDKILMSEEAMFQLGFM